MLAFGGIGLVSSRVKPSPLALPTRMHLCDTLVAAACQQRVSACQRVRAWASEHP